MPDNGGDHCASKQLEMYFGQCNSILHLDLLHQISCRRLARISQLILGKNMKAPWATGLVELAVV